MSRLCIGLIFALAACASPGVSDPRVTIDLHDTSLAAVIAEFRRQVPEAEITAEGWPAGFRIKHVVVRDEPWREALTSLAEGLDGEIWDEPAGCHVRRVPRVTFAVRNATIQAVITRLERESGATILLDAKAWPSTITMSIRNVPWDGALKAIASVCGCQVLRVSGSTYRVEPVGKH